MKKNGVIDIQPEDGRSASEGIFAQTRETFKENNVTVERLAKKLNELLDWESCKVFSYQGEVNKSDNMPDGKIQVEAVKTAAQAMGIMRSQVEVVGGQINLISNIDRTPRDGEFKSEMPDLPNDEQRESD